MELPDAVVLGSAAGASIALGAVGLALSRRVLGFFPFSHAALFVVGAYAALAVSRWGGGRLWMTAAAIAGGAALGLLVDLLCFQPLRRRRSGDLEPTMASLGIMLATQAVIAMSFGTETEVLPWGDGSSLRGARVTEVSLLLGAILIGAVSAPWRFSKWGTHVRALSEDRELAEVCGVPTELTGTVTALIAGGVCGAAGLLAGWQTDLNPAMGLRAFMAFLVASILGLRHGVLGPAASGVGVGVMLHWTAATLPLGWRDLPLLVALGGLVVAESKYRAK